MRLIKWFKTHSESTFIINMTVLPVKWFKDKVKLIFKLTLINITPLSYFAALIYIYLNRSMINLFWRGLVFLDYLSDSKVGLFILVYDH